MLEQSERLVVEQSQRVAVEPRRRPESKTGSARGPIPPQAPGRRRARQAPMYCGDEVAALVGDVGASVSRFGHAGEDTPKAVLPSAVGELTPEELTRLEPDARASKRWSVGSVALPARRDELMVRTPLNVETGLVQNWDVLEQLWEHAFTQLRSDAKEHPVLCGEPSWRVDAHAHDVAAV